jgi:polyvinyl alcohol dehydrogenase (cytochrome)
MDGHLRAHSTADGKLLWDLDTLRDFETVNGVKAHGGSMNVSGPTVADGMLFVNSGYNVLIGLPGNVLLALSIDGR